MWIQIRSKRSTRHVRRCTSQHATKHVHLWSMMMNNGACCMQAQANPRSQQAGSKEMQWCWVMCQSMHGCWSAICNTTQLTSSSTFKGAPQTNTTRQPAVCHLHEKPTAGCAPLQVPHLSFTFPFLHLPPRRSTNLYVLPNTMPHLLLKHT
jgi:hypothetical protein